MAASLSNGGDVALIPDGFSIANHPDCDQISQRARERGLNFYTQGYIHDIKIVNGSTIVVDGKCYPSMRKSAKPHQIHLDISRDNGVISDALCSCKAG